jgi:hypothetical protein
LTDTKWAAITKDSQQWIYVGDQSTVQTTLESNSTPAPAPTPGNVLYQARVVPRQGLNVRDAVGGRVLRAIPVGTIVQVYESQHGWVRISPSLSEWVSASYLSRIPSSNQD